MSRTDRRLIAVVERWSLAGLTVTMVIAAFGCPDPAGRDDRESSCVDGQFGDLGSEAKSVSCFGGRGFEQLPSLARPFN